jgi:hypothetical protein
MTKKLIYILFVLLLGVSGNSNACRYTVCEIGYSDFGTDNYKLVLFDDADVNKKNTSIFSKTTYAALLDANVESSVLNLSKDPAPKYSEYYRIFKKENQPLAILVSPGGDVFPFYLEKEEAKFTESVWGLLEEITSSVARIQVLNSIIKSYAVVLFIEGKNETENATALKEIKTSVQEISETQEKMPKPFENPAEVITLSYEQIKNERVFLWSLGWKDEFTGNPVAAILYGRGRLMGQVLTGDLLEKKYLNNLLTLVGADCECGLDRSWILGRMMPLRWNKRKQQEVVKWHSFDAENPLVKAEMSKILSISPSKERKQGASGTTTLYGYTESAMKIVESYTTPETNETNTEEIIEPSNYKNIFYLLGGLILLILAVGGFLLFKRKN